MRHKIGQFVRRYRVHWAIIGIVTYAVALAAVVFVFPDVSNLWVSIFVLVSGFFNAVSAVGALLDDE